MSTDFQDYLKRMSVQERGLLFCLPQFIGQYVTVSDGHTSLRETNRMWDVIVNWERIDGSFESQMKAHTPEMRNIAERIEDAFSAQAGRKKLSDILSILDDYAKLVEKMPVDLKSRTQKFIYDVCMAVAAADGPHDGIDNIGLQKRAAIEMLYDSFGLEDEEDMSLDWSRASA